MKTGDYLGRYHIVRKIGEGGMGEVFLAEDPKLGRQVALKVLSADFAADSDRMMRFVYEAISASSLNHPNIITIYEIIDEGDTPFIAMEFVDGETLGRRMKRMPLEVHESIDISIQIATALAAAHDAGVVHRDVKPDNVILRPDGLVKVLDFGLAKLVGVPEAMSPHMSPVPNVHTHPGLVMGTVAYMSPEQARGKLVDARSDIFSFGAVLYQMVSGRMPFTGENDIDTVGSVLHKDPKPLSESARPIPHDVELLIRKALRKNRDERYQSMRELLADLKDIREDLRLDSKNGYRRNADSNGDGNGHFAKGIISGELSDAERGLPTERMNLLDAHSTSELTRSPSTLSGILMSGIKDHPVRSVGVSLLIAVLLGGALFGAYNVIEAFRKPEPFQTMRLSKLTYSGNVESFNAAISPDGKYLAYVTTEGDEEGLLVKQTATESGVTIVPKGQNDLNGIAFSPDSNFVYYSMAEPNGDSAVYQSPAMGGTTRKLIADAEKNVTFSPDGKTIAFIRKSTYVMLANAQDGSNIRELAKAGDGNRFINLSWSPKGDVIAAVYFSQNDSNDHLSQIVVADGSETPISSLPWLRLRGVSWLPDASGLVVSGRDRDVQTSQLWQIDYPDGITKRITNDLSNYQGAVITGDGRSILSVQENYGANLWTASENASTPRQVSKEVGRDEGMSGVAVANDGRTAYTVRVKGDQDIWTMNADGSGNRQLTFDSKANFSPTFSPDGRYIVFVSTRAGNLDIWRMDADGANPIRLTDSPDQDGEPNVSPDGKYVYYDVLDKDRKLAIWRVALAGGPVEQVTKFGAESPIISPDGKSMICKVQDSINDPGAKLALVSTSGGNIVSTFDSSAVNARTVRWSADGSSIVYVGSRDRVDNLWLQPVTGGASHQLTNFESDRIYRFDVSPDGRFFVMARGAEHSDVVKVSDFR